MSPASDEKLLKNANLAGRNLTGLAILVSIFVVILAAVLGVAIFSDKEKPSLSQYLLTEGIAAVAAAYWVLSVAARRGDRNAVAIAMVVLAILAAFSLLSQVAGAGRNVKDPLQAPHGLGALILILIILLLAGNWRTLTELKKRGLWETAFPNARPTKILCIVGGSLLALGITAQFVGGFLVGVDASWRIKHVQQQSVKFIQLANEEEPKFMAALKKFVDTREDAAFDAALKEADALAGKTAALVDETKDIPALQSVFVTYASAVENWKAGVKLMKTDAEKANQRFVHGDTFRVQATNEFNTFIKPPGMP